MKALAGALLRAQQSIGQITLDRRTQGAGSHPYASAEAIVTLVRDALHEHGLVLLPTTRALVVQELGSAGRGGELVPIAPAVVVQVCYLLVHAESGESVALQGAAAAGSVVDRRGCADLSTAGAAAWTYALRDMLRDLALAPKASRESRDTEEPEPRPAAATKPETAAPAAATTKPETAAPAAATTKPETAAPAAATTKPSAGGRDEDLLGVRWSDLALAPDRPAAHATAAETTPRRATSTGGTASNAVPSVERAQAPVSAPANGGSMVQAALEAAGWTEDDALDLSLTADGVAADRNAAKHVHRTLLESIGLERTRAAWRAVGLDARAVCHGEREASWGQIRTLALARAGGGGA